MNTVNYTPVHIPESRATTHWCVYLIKRIKLKVDDFLFVFQEPHYHSEIISMFGFHYELKVMKLEKKGAYKFHVQVRNYIQGCLSHVSLKL